MYLQASKRGTEQQELLTDLQAMATKVTSILDKMQSESTAAKGEMDTAKYNLDCALSVRDAEPGRDILPRGEPAGTQQPTQGTADGSGGSVPAVLASPSKSSSRGIATQPRSPPQQPPAAMSLTLGPDTGAAPPAAELTQVKEEEEVNNGRSGASESAAGAGAIVADSEGGGAEGCAQEDASAGAVYTSSFVLNHLIGRQPRSSVNTPSFGNGSAPQQPASGYGQGFAATLADAAGSAGQAADEDMEDRMPDEERENVPANGAVEGEKACAPTEKKGSQKGGASQSTRPALQLNLPGRDRYGVESHGDEFDDME